MSERFSPSLRLLSRLSTSLIVATPALLLGTDRAPAQSTGDLAGIRERLAAAREQAGIVLGEIKALDAQIYRAGGAVEDQQREVSKTRSRIRSTERNIAQLEEDIRTTKRISNERARAIYKDGPGSVLAALLTAESPGDLPRLSTFWKSVAKRDGRMILTSARAQGDLAAEKADLTSTLDSLRDRAKRLQAMEEGLEKTRARRQGSLRRLRLSIQEAMAAERAALAAKVTAVVPPKSSCRPGSAAKDKRLAALLDWYAPASGPEPFLPPKLKPTGITLSAGASWYGPGFDGCSSASGATFRASQMTAASLSLPFGTLLKATSRGRSVVVVISDRGPFVQGRDIDLSRAAAQAIGLAGVGQISMEVVLPSEPAPPFP